MQTTGLEGNWEALGGRGTFLGFTCQGQPDFPGRQSSGLTAWTSRDFGKEQNKSVVSQSTGMT